MFLHFMRPKIDVRPFKASRNIQHLCICMQNMLCYIKIIYFDLISCLILCYAIVIHPDRCFASFRLNRISIKNSAVSDQYKVIFNRVQRKNHTGPHTDEGGVTKLWPAAILGSISQSAEGGLEVKHLVATPILSHIRQVFLSLKTHSPAHLHSVLHKSIPHSYP